MALRARVLIYNVKFLPTLGRWLERPFLRPRGFWEMGALSRSDEARARLLAEQLARDPRFDVVILCELFATHARRVISEAFLDHGYHVVTCPPSRSLFAPSGLFIASRFPIRDRDFSPYTAASGGDRLARKGILHATLDTDDQEIQLFATHLQADPGGLRARRAQLGHARTFIEKRLEGRAAAPTLLAGDLNVIGEREQAPTEEYAMMRALFEDFADVHHLLTGGAPHPTWNPAANAHMIGDRYIDLERLDYLLLRGLEAHDSLLESASVEVIPFEHDGLPLSDHYALLFELPLPLR